MRWDVWFWSIKAFVWDFFYSGITNLIQFRFHINNGEVTYQCRFIQTETFKKNMVAKRIVVTEFGTSSVPDPCHNIFQRFSSRFKSSEKSDNTMISIYPFGDEYYSFTESPVIHKWVVMLILYASVEIWFRFCFRINIETLKTEGRVSVSDFVGIVSHTSHPHVLPNGTVNSFHNLLLSVKSYFWLKILGVQPGHVSRLFG